MILRTELVSQRIDGDRTVELTKDILMTVGHPLGMVRKRRRSDEPTRGAVVLVHGFAQNRYTWHTTQRSFSAYLAADGWDVFTAELRGHGRSRHFSELRARMLDEHIREDFPAFVREAVTLSGHEKVFLIGHSMGGLLSYAAAATTVRERVKGLVTLASPYRFGAGNAALMGVGKLFSGLRLTGVFDRNPRFPTGFVGKVARWFRPVIDTALVPRPVRGWYPGAVEPAVLDEFLDRSFEHTSVRIMVDLFSGGDRVALSRTSGYLDYGVAFRGLDVPLLVIAGTEDALAPPPAVKRGYLASGSRDKTFRVFPLGHVDIVLGREATTTVWPVIREWLERRQ